MVDDMVSVEKTSNSYILITSTPIEYVRPRRSSKLCKSTVQLVEVAMGTT